jgi:uroporphyrinogen-III synthase
VGGPLEGIRIAITRAEEQADGLAERLRALGAKVEVCPAISFAPSEDFARLDAALRQLATYDWLILTSANGVRAVFQRLAQLGLAFANPIRSALPIMPSAAVGGRPSPVGHTAPRLAAIGPATAAELERHGLRPGFVPSAYVAEAILEEIGDVAGQRILLPRADIARKTLAEGLRAKGATVDDMSAYRTLPGEGARRLAPLLRARQVDAITFTSSSTVRFLLEGLDAAGLARREALALLAAMAVVCIGPITAATAHELGLRVDAVAEEYTSDGLVQTLVDWFSQSARA